MQTGQTIWLWSLTLFVYALLPLVDFLLGSDRSNPPESFVPLLEDDPYYRNLLYLQVPLVYLVFVGNAWFFVNLELSLIGQLAIILTTGFILGYALNLGHELGHKKASFDQWMTRLVLAPVVYVHFTVEHNRGHHVEVATPEDCASARMGESIYAFLLREYPGAWKRSWQLETMRLEAQGRSKISFDNAVIQSLLLGLGFQILMIVLFGWAVLPYLLGAVAWGSFQLTSANYVEHYGLLRSKTDSERYERCQPKHSWNSNHLVSNWLTLHLQRHSDHHAHASRSFQALRHFDDVPQLPSGYFGMFPCAYIPSLWFKIMDRRLIEAVDGAPEGINFQLGKEQKLRAKYQF